MPICSTFFMQKSPVHKLSEIVHKWQKIVHKVVEKMFITFSHYFFNKKLTDLSTTIVNNFFHNLLIFNSKKSYEQNEQH